MGKKKRFSKKQITITIITAVLVLSLTLTGILIAVFGKGESESAGSEKDKEVVTENESQVIIDEEDLQFEIQEEKETESESGADVDVEEIIDPNRTDDITNGIDVSKYQGTIKWKKVAEAGIDFAMIRVGYRTAKSGEIVADTNAKYNMQEAQKYGIKVGVYFFSTAITKEEAVKEANWVADYIAKYQITYPVAFDCEGYEKSSSRQYGMTNAQRTDVALAFMARIAERGYSPMFYAAKSDMQHNSKWEMEKISSLYNVWVAYYPSTPYPKTADSGYAGEHVMWQHTNKGNIPGINGVVDMNVAYFGYKESEKAQDDETPEQAEADVEALMKFTSVNETVTAKDKTNLRNKPSQGEGSKVMKVLANGDTATRTGKSSSGWSRVVYNGETYYAVSSYLTTDLDYKTPQEEPDDGIKTEFKTVNEKVTAKDAVNLRTLPSVTNEKSEVKIQIKNGDVVTRTGINTEVGWSRVEYNGETLYCVSSYLMLAE